MNNKTNILSNILPFGKAWLGICIAFLALTSCEKEIDMDYHTVEPL